MASPIVLLAAALSAINSYQVDIRVSLYAFWIAIIAYLAGGRLRYERCCKLILEYASAARGNGPSSCRRVKGFCGGQRAMPNIISDVPIDWASVNWLYVAVLSGLVFLSTLIATLAFRGAVISALLFAAGFVFWTYYPHGLPLPTSITAQKMPAPAVRAAPSAPVTPANPVTPLPPPPSSPGNSQ